VTDISSGIQGTFNQANLASRRAEAEKARARKGEDERVRDARRRFVTTQEEVQEARDPRGARVDPDKENTHGQDARDQYDAHDEMTAAAQQRDRDTDATRQSDQEGDDALPPEADSGHLIDIEA